MKASNAASESFLVSAIQISWSARLAFDCWLFGSLFKTLRSCAPTGERHRRDKPDVEAGFDQAPRDGTVIVAGRLLGICSIVVKGREGQR